MNEHEIDRIAAAMHAARPDWPARSIATLIRKNLADRPRRDVFVALAWIASEPNSHTPARVLEQGPWWKAAGVESTPTSSGGAKFYGWTEGDPRNICGVCGLDRAACTARARTNGHDFIARTDCLPPLDTGVVGAIAREGLICGAEVLGGTTCRLKPSHQGDHAMGQTPPPLPDEVSLTPTYRRGSQPTPA